MTKSDHLIRLHPDDHVAIARQDIPVGTAISADVRARTNVPQGHKIACRNLSEGDPVLKFGQPIGVATTAISAGDHVHTHNVAVPPLRSEKPSASTPAFDGTAIERQFAGYRRANGKIGTRNYIGILTSVNCSATVARRVASHFSEDVLKAYPHVDGVVPITHQTGCGQSAHGDGIANLRRALGGFARHPNFGGVLIIGLGCEVNQIDLLLSDQQLDISDRLKTLTIQEAGGTAKSIDIGIELTHHLLESANTDRREPCSAAGLVLGVQCGGSDAWSGISANPSLGAASDLVVRAGGSVILAETPEIYGAEQLLLARAERPAVADALLDRIRWWEDYVRRNGQELNNNPSPGNLKGGLTTILEKSLGAVAKSGTAPLRGVVLYGEPVSGPGFHFMDSPGYDPCSVTGEIASGANIICFTTGRGSVFGSKPTPSLKLASNAELAIQMEDDIDVDCSPVINGTTTVQERGEAIFELILRVASGETTRSEVHGFGDFEFVPWQVGAYV